MLFEILSEIGNGTRQRRGAILSGSISIEVRWKIRGIRAFRLIGAAIIYRSHYRSENGSGQVSVKCNHVIVITI